MYILKAEFYRPAKSVGLNNTSTQHFETFGKTESESTQIGIHDTFLGNSCHILDLE